MHIQQYKHTIFVKGVPLLLRNFHRTKQVNQSLTVKITYPTTPSQEECISRSQGIKLDITRNINPTAEVLK